MLAARGHSYAVVITANSTGKKVKVEVIGSVACGMLDETSGFVKVKKKGKFSTSASGPRGSFAVQGKFKTKTKAKGTASGTPFRGRACGVEGFTAKPAG